MRKLTNRLGIKSKILFANIVIVFFALLIVGLFSYQYMYNFSLKKAQEYELNVLHLISENFDRFLDDLNISTYSILTNVEIKRALEFANLEGVSTLKVSEIEDALASLLFSRNEILSVELYDFFENRYSTQGFHVYDTEYVSELYDIASANRGKIGYISQSPSSRITFIRLVYNLNLEPVGILQVDIKRSVIDNLLLHGDSMGELFLIDADGEILASSSPRIIPTHISENTIDEALITKYNSNYFGWEYIASIPKNSIATSLIGIRRMYFLLFAVVFLVLVFVSFLLAHNIWKPVDQIVTYVQGVNIEGWSPIFMVDSNNEAHVLNESINQMLERIKELTVKKYKAELLREQQRFSLLQSKINPHFLYNTFDLLNWQARAQGSDTIGEIIHSLSSLLRYSLESPSEEVTVEEELNMIATYFEIQQFRFGNRLQVEYDVDQRLYDQGIIRLALQPIVENCFKYRPSDDSDIQIAILGKMQSLESYEITISDNGLCLSEDSIYKLNQDIHKKHTGTMAHIGLSNVHERIQIQYGENYGLTICTSCYRGFAVKVRLPLI